MPGLLAVDGPYGSCGAVGAVAYARPAFIVGGAYGLAPALVDDEDGCVAAFGADIPGAGAYGSSCGFVRGCAAYGLRAGEATAAEGGATAEGAGAYGLYELAGAVDGAAAYGFAYADRVEVASGFE